MTDTEKAEKMVADQYLQDIVDEIQIRKGKDTEGNMKTLLIFRKEIIYEKITISKHEAIQLMHGKVMQDWRNKVYGGDF